MTVYLAASGSGQRGHGVYPGSVECKIGKIFLCLRVCMSMREGGGVIEGGTEGENDTHLHILCGVYVNNVRCYEAL